jgi:hypothetical protein
MAHSKWRTHARSGLSGLAMAICCGLSVPAAAAERSETVKFEAGAISATLSGRIKGYDGVNYLFDARAGQVISILFSPKNRSCYFNVFGPGADMAVHIGSSNGNEFGANLTASGQYRAQVYLMRNAARRGESCKYSMTIEISGGAPVPAPAGDGGGAEELPMLRACAEDATKLYGVTQDKVRFDDEGAIAPAPAGFEMHGEVDKGAEGRKQFKCLFGKDRALRQVMPLNSDGR